MNDTTTMTAEDLKLAGPLADAVIQLVTKDVRPPCAVAALALAFAATAHLAKCGPTAAQNLFKNYFDKLEEAGA
jgi:hypothetical protein